MTTFVLVPGMWLGAYQIDDYQRPSWPEGQPPKQFHLDLSVENLDEAEAAAVGLGATKSDHQPEPDRWRVTFAGNSLTSRETVEAYLLFRASELSVQNGYDWFEIVDRHTNRDAHT